MQNVLIYTNLSTQKSSSGHRSKRACIFLGAYHQHKNSHKHVSLVCMYDCVHFLGGRVAFLNIAKGTTDPRVEFISQDITQILIKFQFQNLDKALLQNLNQTSTFRLNFNIKILTKPCAQSLKNSLALWPNLSFQICNKLLPTWSSSSTSATVTTSTRFELPSSHARATSIKSNKCYGVSQLVSLSVSQWVSDKHCQWSDSGPIKMVMMMMRANTKC